MSAPHDVFSVHLYSHCPWHTPFQPDFSNFLYKPTIFVFQGESASWDLFPFLLSILFCKSFHFFSTPSWSRPPQSSPLLRVWQGNKCPINHLWTPIPSPQAGDNRADVLRAWMLLPQVTLGHPKGLTQGQDTDPPQPCPEKCRPKLLANLLWRVNYLSGPKRVIKTHINALLGQWVLIRSPFCVNIQIRYYPREMNNSGYLISLTILNIMKSHTIIPHPSPWILATDRSPVGNGNVTLIHLFTKDSLPNNFQYPASHPKTFLWKQARTDIHCKLVFTTV